MVIPKRKKRRHAKKQDQNKEKRKKRRRRGNHIQNKIKERGLIQKGVFISPSIHTRAHLDVDIMISFSMYPLVDLANMRYMYALSLLPTSSSTKSFSNWRNRRDKKSFGE
jgi:hypothetical protein